ncbi:hypothetical protein HZC32_01945 [Candidatus Woesearchaeota archaeon]|nr:hypothetical protein [Candidatus Woesearchaeota archaeon]
MEPKPSLSRRVAAKITIAEVLAGTYVQDNEQSPNYFLTKDKRQLYRINLMAVVLSQQQQGSITNIFVDDGTGKITVRSFEENQVLNQLQVGDSLLIIGKVRVYSQEKYIYPEIVRKISPEWFKLRALELRERMKINIFPDDINFKNSKAEDQVGLSSKSKTFEINAVTNNNIEPEIEEIKVSDEEVASLLPKKILNLIKEMDQGEGVLVEEIISKSNLTDIETILEKMLEKGDIFQNLPGRVKAL